MIPAIRASRGQGRRRSRSHHNHLIIPLLAEVVVWAAMEAVMVVLVLVLTLLAQR